MAVSGWREKLNSSSLFKALADSVEQLPKNNESLNILICKDDTIFVWDEYNQCILSAVKSSEKHLDKHQTLLCSRPPIGKVTDLLPDDHGKYIALVGQNFLSVLEIPTRWGQFSEFEGGKPSIICKLHVIGERFFICNPKVKILQAKWLPSSDSCITILSSDNFLRIYKLEDPQNPVQEYNLSSTDGDLNLSSSFSFNVPYSLGETAISFDFGLCVERDDVQILPVFILNGSGDVYYMSLPMPLTNRPYKPVLLGPLLMHPAADDNYGADSCRIMCLQSNPPILVIAASSGTLYHCLALENNNNNDESEIHGNYKSRNDLDWSLYVFECIELELSMTTSASEEDILCPISLHRDPNNYAMYYCSHAAGVHAVALPMAEHIDMFIKEDDNASLPNLQQQECIVEHLVCTKPLPSSPDSPILGVTTIESHLHGSTLLCLMSTMEAICLSVMKPSLEKTRLVSDFQETPFVSPMKEVNKESFEKHIAKVLQKNSSNPLMKSNPDSSPNVEERLQLLSRATQIFREEYINRLDIARLEIEKRVRVLNQNKKQQLLDIESIDGEKKDILDNLQKLMSTYKHLYDKQKTLVQRTEVVLMKIQKSVPVFSKAEQNLQKEFEDMKRNMKTFDNRMEKVVKMKEYQEKHDGNDIESNKQEKLASFLAEMNKGQVSLLKGAIEKESEEIRENKKLINSLKKDLML